MMIDLRILSIILGAYRIGAQSATTQRHALSDGLFVAVADKKGLQLAGIRTDRKAGKPRATAPRGNRLAG